MTEAAPSQTPETSRIVYPSAVSESAFSKSWVFISQPKSTPVAEAEESGSLPL